MDWLNRLLSSRTTVTPQPRCECGRFCAKHDKPEPKTAKLVSELSASGRYVPEFYRRSSQKGAV